MTSAVVSREQVVQRLSWRSVAIGAGVVLCVTYLVVPASVRPLAVFPIVTAVPGWPILGALFGDDMPTDWATRLVFVIALGIGADIASGLAIGEIGAGFGPASWIVALTLVTAGASWVATRRGTDLDVRRPRMPSERVMAASAISAIVACIGVAVAVNTSPNPTSAPFTEFAFAGAAATQGQPPRVAPGGTIGLPVTVRRSSPGGLAFRLATSVDGVASGSELVTANGSTWTGTVRSSVPPGDCLHRVDVRMEPADGVGSAQELVTYVQGSGPPCRS